MGYSCTAKADEVMHTFRGDEGSGNVWVHNGRRYFFERVRENRDGAITGAIYQYVGESQARRAGSYRIGPDGTIARAPYGLRARLSPEAGEAAYLRKHDPRGLWNKACEHDGIPAGTAFAVFSDGNPYR